MHYSISVQPSLSICNKDFGTIVEAISQGAGPIIIIIKTRFSTPKNYFQILAHVFSINI